MNTPMPRLGMGTWHLAEGRHPETQEIAALRAGLDAGITLIDTAEMYADGRAESLVGRAIAGYDRSRLFIVSKVYPHNAGRRHLRRSLEASLKRLGTDYLDMYLLHWRGSVPLAETVECMEQAKDDGLIRNWGVSNFDTNDMRELFATPGGEACAVNQDLYHLGSRGVEYDLLPWMDAHGLPLMAYCPLAQAGTLRRGLLESPAVRTVASDHGVEPIQVLLAFVLHRPDTIAIPCSGNAEHVRANLQARDLKLSADELALLDQAFPAPTSKQPLDME
ncbi:aldo/keto reductase [Bifidobacterium felsineum]|uniref:Aldo/keto reductase n=1 Tax=Bifidobacterium felsineum TaxID=2045440 RepID=A0A2M9HIJ9_9BIFI|nr:aldo/keto reductase [Bifidobacterium felsineum]MBT1164914.1 aldo/keto reductase [Bifidobacterium felsineum]PJM76650.1 aldo/keto reductase [Bifidobacterium felsineum]